MIQCSECGKLFVRDPWLWNKLTCSPACSRERERRRPRKNERAKSNHVERERLPFSKAAADRELLHELDALVRERKPDGRIRWWR